MLVQQLADGGLVGDGPFLDGDQALFGGHHLTDADFQAAFETHVAGSHDAHQVAVVQHRHAGDVVGLGQVEQVAHGGVGFDGDGVLDHTGLETLDLAHFGSLLLDGHVLVDDADAAFLSHGDRQTGFSDGVHGGGNQWDIQLDATGQTGL